MGIADSIGNAFEGNLRLPLLADENIVYSGIGTLKVGRMKVVNVDAILTNQRLITQSNTGSEIAMTLGSAAGGAATGLGIAGVGAGAWAGSKAGHSAKSDNFIFISDIANLTPSKRKIFGIPLTDTVLDIADRNGQIVTIYFMKRQRDEWITKINQAKAAAGPPQNLGWQS